ncbi:MULTISPECIES: hypothetical protein [Tenacibaculum]|uniref:Uncharacterized protein n=2 Tax=Tenacibaculum TaxID=104267 RepID=A0AAE9SHT7_9FLAO|nr:MULTISPECIES: hypothetical protein [Tenacibaculum]GFD96346.1 hypothetical protein KUL154_50790 [Alteromonas sp. KUL154]GFE02795.1 hypothetical protein KUL156_53870 [Alteromonas sp. KUL156]AZJ32216.1 hypothetical protein D6200_06410 [Tenacibaculum mesophilum]KAF9658326.1 hypothetical protein HBA12_14135 [Tenacibaculum mesophilum]MDE1208416.1 hypothetical protein [Tenacibaculum larymnensis]
MLNKIVNLNGVTILNRKELHSIAGSTCRIAVRNEDGSFRHWSAKVYSVEEAQSAYQLQQEYNDGSYASGYCCASC